MAAALARWALRVSTEAAAGLQTSTGEVAAARWLDAEDATMGQVLAWAINNDPATVLRLAVALAWWWLLRGRLASNYPLLREAASYAEAGSDGWCVAQFWLGQTALYSADLATALSYFSAVRDAPGSRMPSPALVDCLGGRSVILAKLGRIPEAADDGRRSLALARESGYPAGEALALVGLTITAFYVGDLEGAVQFGRQAAHNTADIPGSITRYCSYVLADALTEAGDPATAERMCMAGLARSRDVGDLWNLRRMLTQMAILDLQAGRIEDAAAHLREVLQLAVRTSGRSHLLDALYFCGYLCDQTRRYADAVTVWAAEAALSAEGYRDPPLYIRRQKKALRKAWQVLGPARARAAEDRGAAMSLDTAAEFALMLTAPGPQPSAATPGGVKLSARERELVALVAQGRTDVQIAAQLYISVRTVRTYLDRIRDKTGCRRRADLTRLALLAGLV